MAKKDIFKEFSETMLSGGDGVGRKVKEQESVEPVDDKGGFTQMSFFIDEETRRRLGLLRLNEGGKYKDYVLEAVKDFLKKKGY